MGKISSLITSKTWSTKRLTSEGTSELRQLYCTNYVITGSSPKDFIFKNAALPVRTTFWTFYEHKALSFNSPLSAWLSQMCWWWIRWQGNRNKFPILGRGPLIAALQVWAKHTTHFFSMSCWPRMKRYVFPPQLISATSEALCSLTC